MQVEIQIGGKKLEVLKFPKQVGHPVIADYIQHSQGVRQALGGKLAKRVEYSKEDKDGNYTANIVEPVAAGGPTVVTPTDAEKAAAAKK